MSRSQMLTRIRDALGAEANDTSRESAVSTHLANRPRCEAPSRAIAPNTDLVSVFKNEAIRQNCDIGEVDGIGSAPPAIAEYLKANNQPLKLRHGNDAALLAVDFAGAGLETCHGHATSDDTAGLSVAYAGIAETGTMALLSGPENPVTLAFLPDTHVVIVPRRRILATYEDAFEILQNEKGAGVMPRTLNLVSGPSRTADIGGRIVIGAHGPRRLFMIIVAEL